MLIFIFLASLRVTPNSPRPRRPRTSMASASRIASSVCKYLNFIFQIDEKNKWPIKIILYLHSIVISVFFQHLVTHLQLLLLHHLNEDLNFPL